MAKLICVSDETILAINKFKIPDVFKQIIKENAFYDLKKIKFDIIQRGILYDYPIDICELCGEYKTAQYEASKDATMRIIKTNLKCIERKRMRGICEDYDYTGCKYNKFLKYINSVYRRNGIHINIRIEAYLGQYYGYYTNEGDDYMLQSITLDEYSLREIGNLYYLIEKKINCNCYFNEPDGYFYNKYLKLYLTFNYKK